MRSARWWSSSPATAPRCVSKAKATTGSSPTPGARTTRLGDPSFPRRRESRALSKHELPVTALRDFGRLAPVVHAVTVETQHAADTPALHVAIDAGLPRIDLAREQPLGRLDDDLRPLRHVLGPR